MTHVSPHASAAPIEPLEAHASAAWPARAQRHAAILAELAELGMDLARALHRQVTANPQADETSQKPPADAHLVFARISRAIRMTLALEARLATEADLEARTRAADAAAQAAADAARCKAETAKQEARRHHVRRIVQQVIDADPTERESPERENNGRENNGRENNGRENSGRENSERETSERETSDRESRETLEDLTDDEADLSGPLPDIIARICRDLGLTPDWTRWDAAPWQPEQAGFTRPPATTLPDIPPANPAPEPPPPTPAPPPGPTYATAQDFIPTHIQMRKDFDVRTYIPPR